VINKIDLPNAEIEKTKKEIIHLLGCKEEEILEASGKTGEGVKKILERVIKMIPPPRVSQGKLCGLSFLIQNTTLTKAFWLM